MPNTAAGSACIRGPAIVGNIGAPGRINYTLVGETVNIAQRLEQLGKEYRPREEVVIVASRADLERAECSTRADRSARKASAAGPGRCDVYTLVQPAKA